MPKTCESAPSGIFVMLPVDLLLSDRCSPIALKLYAVLLMYCRDGATAWPGQPRLARDMHISERHVRTVLEELEQSGLIRKEQRPGTSTLYHVHKYKLLAAAEGADRTHYSAPPRNSSSHEVHKSESHKIYTKDFKPLKPWRPKANSQSHTPIDFSKFEPGGAYYGLVHSSNSGYDQPRT